MAKPLAPEEGIRAEGSTNFNADLAPHELRMIDEAKELYERLAKLDTFVTSGQSKNLSVTDRALMQRQSQHMADYLYVLNARIGRFITKIG